jgi:hypothetical protein
VVAAEAGGPALASTRTTGLWDLVRRADSPYAAVAAAHATMDHPIQRLRTV